MREVKAGQVKNGRMRDVTREREGGRKGGQEVGRWVSVREMKSEGKYIEGGTLEVGRIMGGGGGL